jgi:hypothetical protein
LRDSEIRKTAGFTRVVFLFSEASVPKVFPGDENSICRIWQQKQRPLSRNSL